MTSWYSQPESLVVRLIPPVGAVTVVLASVGLLATPHYAWALLPPVVLLCGLVLVTRPEWAYLAVVALIPMGAFRGPQHFVLAAGLAAVVLVRHRSSPLPAGWMKCNLWPWLLVFLGWLLLSSMASPFGAESMENYRTFLLNYLFFALHLYFASAKATRTTIPVVLVTSITIGGALAILGYYAGLPWFAEENEGFRRGSGGSASGPALALSILLAAPFLVLWLFHAPRRWMRVLAGVALPVNLLAMVTTFSRGGALVLVLLCGLLFLQHARSFHLRTVLLLGGAGALLVLLAALLVPSHYWERQLSLTDPADFSVGRRTTYLLVAREAFADRPLLGYGHDTFGELYALSSYAREFQRKSQVDLFRRAHNTYVEAAIGGGIVGLAAFLGLIGTAFLNLNRACRSARCRNDDSLAAVAAAYRLAFLGALLYFLVYSNLDNKYLILALPLTWRMYQLATLPSADDHA